MLRFRCGAGRCFSCESYLEQCWFGIVADGKLKTQKSVPQGRAIWVGPL